MDLTFIPSSFLRQTEKIWEYGWIQASLMESTNYSNRLKKRVKRRSPPIHTNNSNEIRKFASNVTFKLLDRLFFPSSSTLILKHSKKLDTNLQIWSRTAPSSSQTGSMCKITCTSRASNSWQWATKRLAQQKCHRRNLKRRKLKKLSTMLKTFHLMIQSPMKNLLIANVKKNHHTRTTSWTK